MREARLYTQPEWLHERYWVEKLSIKKLGTLCNVKACTIRKHMKKNNIPSRTESKASEECYGVSKFKDKKWLIKKYWKQNYTLREIATICGRDRKTVSAWMDEFNIPRRSKTEWLAKARETKRKRDHRSLCNRFIDKARKAIKNLDDYMRRADVDN